MGIFEMPVSESAKAAIAALNKKEIYGRKIALSEAGEKEPERNADNFQRPRREYRVYDQYSNGEIEGNKW
jgi:RNA recognition motif-containing protein